METGIAPLAWSPLGGGALMTSTDLPPALYETCDRLAARENTDRAGLRWLLCWPTLPGPSRYRKTPVRLTQAVNALE